MSHLFTHARFLISLMAVGFLLTLHSSKIHADDAFETREHLQSIVQDFITEQVQHPDDERILVNINMLDSHLTLSRCGTHIDASFPDGSTPSQFNAIALKCVGEPGWAIYVPVTIQTLISVVTTNRLMSPGDLITEHDLNFEEADKSRLYEGFFKQKNDAIGFSVLRTLAPGTVLTPRNIHQLAVIKRNQTVTLVLKKGNIEIDMIGIAKSDGYMNDSVKIWNPASKKMIDAMVIGPDRAQLIG